MKKLIITIMIVLLFSNMSYLKSESKKGNTLLVTDSTIQVGFEYGEKYMLLDFKKSGVNSLMAVSKVSIKDGNKITTLMNSCTDWIGPYIVRADRNGNKNTPAFTGGWHGFNGDKKTTATARTVSYLVYADNKKVVKNKAIGCDNINLQIINLVQGYNTKEINGKGRHILKELINYSINGFTINVSTHIQALEDITIEQYYGLQTQNSAWRDLVEYVKVDLGNVYTYNGFSGYIYSKSASEVQKYILKSKDDMLIAWMDTNLGLGKRQYLSKDKAYAFTLSNGKSYFNLINGVEAKMKKGANLMWTGGYMFKPTVKNN